MKKFWIVLLVLLVAAAVLAVALLQDRSPQKPEDPLAQARAKMSEVGSMRFEMKMNMDISVFRQEMNVDLTMAGEMTSDPAAVHGDLTVTMGQENPAEMEVYMESVNGETVTYVGLPAEGGTEWSAQRGGSTAAGADLQTDTMELLSLVTLAVDAEPEQISETELRYTGVIPAEQIRFALNAAGMLPQLEETGLIDASVLERTGKELEDLSLTITVDSARQIVTGYSLDMTAVVRQILLASLERSAVELGIVSLPEEMLEVTGVTTQMRLYDFDLVEPIVIPEEAKR